MGWKGLDWEEALITLFLNKGLRPPPSPPATPVYSLLYCFVFPSHQPNGSERCLPGGTPAIVHNFHLLSCLPVTLSHCCCLWGSQFQIKSLGQSRTRSPWVPQEYWMTDPRWFTVNQPGDSLELPGKGTTLNDEAAMGHRVEIAASEYSQSRGKWSRGRRRAWI